MRPRIEVLVLAVATMVSCGLTREENEAISYLRSHPVDLSPYQLTYSNLKQNLRSSPGQPPRSSTRGAYEAHWFGHAIQAVFAGTDKPGPDQKLVRLIIQSYKDGESLPVSLDGIRIGDSIEDVYRRRVDAYGRKETPPDADYVSFNHAFVMIDLTFKRRGKDRVVETIVCRDPNWSFYKAR